MGLAACSAKKNDLIGETALSPDQSLEADLKKVDTIIENENSNPSIINSPQRSPAATPLLPGTTLGNPDHQGSNNNGPGFDSRGPGGAPLESFVYCQPTLEQRAYGVFPANTVYGRQEARPSVSNALWSLALPSVSVSGDAFWDANMVKEALGKGNAFDSDLAQAAKSNPLFSAAFDYVHGTRRDGDSAALAILLTALIRTSDQPECQRQVLERAKIAFQSRPQIPWAQIEAQLANVRSDILTGHAKKKYSDLTEQRRALLKTLSTVQNFKTHYSQGLVQTLKQESSKAKSCRPQLSFLELTGGLDGLQSQEQIAMLTETFSTCLRKAEQSLERAESRPRAKRNHAYEDRLIAEKIALETSIAVLSHLEKALVWTPDQKNGVNEVELRQKLQDVESRWVTYHYFSGLGT